MTPCPSCHGQRLNAHPAGPLTYQHTPTCPHQASEDATKHADHQRLNGREAPPPARPRARHQPKPPPRRLHPTRHPHRTHTPAKPRPHFARGPTHPPTPTHPHHHPTHLARTPRTNPQPLTPTNPLARRQRHRRFIPCERAERWPTPRHTVQAPDQRRARHTPASPQVGGAPPSPHGSPPTSPVRENFVCTVPGFLRLV